MTIWPGQLRLARGEFPQGESRRGVGLQSRHPLLQEFHGDPADQIDGRLGVLGAGQLILGSLEGDLAERVSEDLVGLAESGLGLWKRGGEVLAHADHLGSLSGEEKRGLHVAGEGIAGMDDGKTEAKGDSNRVFRFKTLAWSGCLGTFRCLLAERGLVAQW